MTVAVAVVGGGITGLAAALRLRDRLGQRATITVYEQSDALGGKLRTGSVAGGLAASERSSAEKSHRLASVAEGSDAVGLAVERGADAFLVRAPGGDGDSAAVSLARRVGLAGDLVHPQPVPAALWLDGELRPLPPGTLLGVPGDLARVADLAHPEPVRDSDEGKPVLAVGEDVSVGELVRRRLGDQVVDRLVDPMLGGVYAGRADALSLAATMPGLAAACRTEPTLVGAVRAALAAAPRPAGAPVFGGIRGGLSRLVEALAAASAATLRLGRPVRELAATAAGSGWRLVVGSTRDAEPVEADAVVLALPARPAARLLNGVDAAVAAQVGVLDYASVALVTLALPPSVELPEWSGFLVPAGEGLATKAVTFLTRKWAHLRGDGDPVLVRASVGRYGEVGPLRLDDAGLVRLVHGELARVVGHLPPPVDTHVQRWGGALPQYLPGHLDRIAAARAALPATLRLAGAGYDGVGIPACIGSGQSAADEVAAAVGGAG
jgi:oxygen-dependent protoporphyrinogen oxidase